MVAPDSARSPHVQAQAKAAAQQKFVMRSCVVRALVLVMNMPTGQESSFRPFFSQRLGLFLVPSFWKIDVYVFHFVNGFNAKKLVEEFGLHINGSSQPFFGFS